jgi:hypothetical protein
MCKNRGSSNFPLRFRGARGGRGLGRGGQRTEERQEFSPAEPKEPQKTPPARRYQRVETPSKPVGPEVPKPEHLSKKATPLTNDPLYIEAFVIEGDRGFTEDAGAQTFTVTTDSFRILVTTTYHTVCAADKEFSRFVSLTMYQYYNVLQFWARIAAFREHRGMASIEELNLVHYLSSNEYPVRDTINSYLRGIGEFENPSGIKHKFRLLQLPGINVYEGVGGFFGKVGANTHYLYESLPAPGVVALRLLRDLG